MSDVDELKPLLAQLHEASYHWALSCCDWRRDVAEDVLQTSYLKVIDGRAKYQGSASVKTWFFGVLRMTAREHRRKQWLQGLGLGKLIRLSADEENQPSPVVENELDEIKIRVREALKALSVMQRSILELVFFQDLSVQEAADVMGIKVGSASVHYARAKKRMKQQLESQ